MQSHAAALWAPAFIVYWRPLWGSLLRGSLCLSPLMAAHHLHTHRWHQTRSYFLCVALGNKGIPSLPALHRRCPTRARRDPAPNLKPPAPFSILCQIPPSPPQVLPDLSEERWQYAGTEIFKETGETARVWEWDLTGGWRVGRGGAVAGAAQHAFGRLSTVAPQLSAGVGLSAEQRGTWHAPMRLPPTRLPGLAPPTCCCTQPVWLLCRGRGQRDEVPLLRHTGRRAAAPVDDGHQPVLGYACRGVPVSAT